MFDYLEESLGSRPPVPLPLCLCSGPGESVLDRTPGLGSCAGCKENQFKGAVGGGVGRRRGYWSWGLGASGHLRTWGPPGRVPALSLRENQLVTVQRPGSLWGAAAMGEFQCPGGGRRRWVWEGFTLMNGVTVPQETPGSSLAPSTTGGHSKNSPSVNRKQDLTTHQVGRHPDLHPQPQDHEQYLTVVCGFPGLWDSVTAA